MFALDAAGYTRAIHLKNSNFFFINIDYYYYTLYAASPGGGYG